MKKLNPKSLEYSTEEMKKLNPKSLENTAQNKNSKNNSKKNFEEVYDKGKSKVDFRKTPKRYELLLKEIYNNSYNVTEIIEEFGIELVDWTVSVSKNWECWMKEENPRIGNVYEVLSKMKEYLQALHK